MFALQVNTVTEPPKTKGGEISSSFVFGGSLVPSTPYSGKRLRRRRRIFRLRGIPTRPVAPQTDAVPVPQRALRANAAFDPTTACLLEENPLRRLECPLWRTHPRGIQSGRKSRREGVSRAGVWRGGKYGALFGERPPTLASGFHQLSFKTVMPPISSTIPSQAQGLRRCPSRSQPPMEVPRMPNPPHMA